MKVTQGVVSGGICLAAVMKELGMVHFLCGFLNSNNVKIHVGGWVRRNGLFKLKAKKKSVRPKMFFVKHISSSRVCVFFLVFVQIEGWALCAK